MRNIWNKFTSIQLSIALLFAYVLIICFATFIEEKYDTATAKLLFYEAKWFEFLMILLVVLFVFYAIKNGSFYKDKLSRFIFHVSFIVLIIGGGVTRYFGFEANMHIVENEEVDVIYTAEPYLQMRMADKDTLYSSSRPLYFSQIEDNDFRLEFDVDGKFIIDYKNYIYNAKEVIEENSKGESYVRYEANDSDRKSFDVLIVDVSYQNKTHEAVLFYADTQYIQKFQAFVFDDLKFEMVYGPKQIDLPFALKLNEFTLTKYPGTNIPSESESSVLLIDERNNVREEHVIAKNKVLDYDGYRFFQTSYDDDENGTIISVNYDYYGTRITYFGYFLMILGALLVLVSKKSSFWQYGKMLKEVRAKRKSLLIALILLVGYSSEGYSQYRYQNPISADHADNFGHMLVQTYDGRFSSVNSLAADVIHKISGKDNIRTKEKGNMGYMQVFLDMHVDPDFWKKQEVIVVREQSLRNIIGISGKYASFNDFDDNGYYKLEELSIRAFRKKASDQSNLEREVIKVTERVNIFMMTINGSLLRLFPEQDSKNNKWISWNDTLAYKPLYGELLIYNEDLQLREYNYFNIMRTYFISTIHARETNDYAIPEKIIGFIKSIQRQLTPKDLLPSEQKIDLEIFYNKSRFFDYLIYVYAFLGIVLLVLALFENFRSKPGEKIKLAIKIFIVLFIAAFVYQTFGMGLRWYLGGHAPWSNGYEVLLLVAWGGVIAGFSVIKYSKITLASTAILASAILMIAGLSYYDPQLTNLNPVLKSYWLIIHVAIITIGYGFLALSFITGLIVVVVNLIKSEERKLIFNLVIEELTYINKRIITIGMFLTAIGTFIGCVWANESWGSYWAWNAKQSWSLIIVLVYGMILHFKNIPYLKSHLAFNIAAIFSFASVIMTFVGVNYYFTKGLHSYASDDPPVFPVWIWFLIISIGVLVSASIAKTIWEEKKSHKTTRPE